jgi:hypothetical protein
VQHTVVTRAAFKTEILKHWPDRTGHPIVIDGVTPCRNTEAQMGRDPAKEAAPTQQQAGAALGEPFHA